MAVGDFNFVLKSQHSVMICIISPDSYGPTGVGFSVTCACQCVLIFAEPSSQLSRTKTPYLSVPAGDCVVVGN